MKIVRGVIRGGVVVLDEALEVPDGTWVLVHIPEPNWFEAIDGAWKDDEGIARWLRERTASRTMSEGPTL